VAAPPQPASEFDALFRRPDGAATPYGQTRVLPHVNADYRMPPPGAAGGYHERSPFEPVSGHPGAEGPSGVGGPPGVHDGWNDDPEPGIRKPIVWGTIGAVIAVSAVILGLLYIGNHNNGAPTGSASASNSAGAAVGSPSASVGAINLPSADATSASPSSSPSDSPSPSASGSTNLPLSLGSSGRYVVYVQERLKQLRFYHGAVNGQYDTATAEAVTEFQTAAHVTGDPGGTVGRATITALIAAGARPNLRPGSSDGGDIRRLQSALNTAENAGLQVNGRYDAATFAAVFRYQTSVGIQPSGAMNGQTWAALQSGSVI
jgi:peptidoglycan hydrolase-like protein with peptidoglycan-binding domain